MWLICPFTIGMTFASGRSSDGSRSIPPTAPSSAKKSSSINKISDLQLVSLFQGQQILKILMGGCLPPTSQCMNLELITLRFTSTGFGSTIQDFFQTFFKTIISFSRLEVIIKQLINTGLKKHWKKLFSWCTANVWAWLKKIGPKRKKFHLI